MIKGKCVKQTVIAIIKTRSGEKFHGSNWCEFPQKICPRDSQGFKSGEGYHLCKEWCGQHNHAEVDALLKAGKKAKGAKLFLIGHSYCCDNCKELMNIYGISEIWFKGDL